MTIYTMCVDAERGRYMAISAEDPAMKAFSHTSENEALGELVQLLVRNEKAVDSGRNRYFSINDVVHVETSG
jgi:hypothetical protein